MDIIRNNLAAILIVSQRPMSYRELNEAHLYCCGICIPIPNT